jgi:hypothetical protein
MEELVDSMTFQREFTIGELTKGVNSEDKGCVLDCVGEILGEVSHVHGQFEGLCRFGDNLSDHGSFFLQKGGCWFASN